MEAVAPKTKDVLILELNEFNIDLLKIATQTLDIPHLSALLTHKITHYKTNDRYNSGYLEPWVQWVSIHSGVPSQKHKIKHLGDIPDLTFKQSWEVLSEHQISMGIWGVMNGSRQGHDQVAFFMPDPWTFDEPAHPDELNRLLALPRYLAKNYQHLKLSALLRHALTMFSFIAASGCALAILRKSISLIRDIIKRGSKHYVFIAFFDYIATLLFIKYKKQYHPKCSILFLNSLAHIQHHHWRDGAETITPEIAHGLKNIDKILGLLKKAFPHDAFIMHNGLSQMNTNHEKPWVLYRQKDPKNFLQKMALQPIRVEQHMTHDGHAFFKNETQRDHAFEFLQALNINNKKLFHVEKNQHDKTKLFYQLSYTDKILNNAAEVKTPSGSFAFFQYFDAIVTRTGRHIPIGTVISDTIDFPDHCFNHEFHRFVHHYLDPVHFPLHNNETVQTPNVQQAVGETIE